MEILAGISVRHFDVGHVCLVSLLAPQSPHGHFLLPIPSDVGCVR